MPKGPQGEKRPADAIGRAVQVAKIATREIEDTRYVHPKKAISGRVDGKVRAVRLTAQQRSNVARQGADARWKDNVQNNKKDEVNE